MEISPAHIIRLQSTGSGKSALGKLLNINGRAVFQSFKCWFLLNVIKKCLLHLTEA